MTLEEWHDHLTTLFPEVRPRGHFELRSADAVAPRWYAAPLALAVGITYDPGALRAAADLLGAPDLGLLDRAGRVGLRDPALASTAADLADIALDGCAALGPGYFHPADLEPARAFFDRYTRRGLCPGGRAPVGRGGGLAPSPPARRSGSDRPRTPSTPS